MCEVAARKLFQVITVDQFESIIKATTQKHHKLAYALGFYAGLRISEVVKLTTKDVDHSRNMIFVSEGKGKKDRYVPIAKPLKAVLNKIKLPVGVGARALEMAIVKVSKNVLGDSIKFHTLRHSCATHYLSKGMNIREVQQLLGHSRLDTTMIYTHVSPDAIKASMDDIWD